MRNRRHVSDETDLESRRLQRPEGGLATGSGPFEIDLNRAHAVIHGLARRVLRRHLSGEGSALAGASETGTSSSRPTKCVTLAISNGNDRIIKRGMNMRNAIDDGSTRFLFCRFLCWLCHKLFHLTFQRACSDLVLTKRHDFDYLRIGFLGPFLVLALVLVRWPLTGSERR